MSEDDLDSIRGQKPLGRLGPFNEAHAFGILKPFFHPEVGQFARLDSEEIRVVNAHPMGRVLAQEAEGGARRIAAKARASGEAPDESRLAAAQGSTEAD